MKNKNLIKDILTYLKENDEARERFAKLINFPNVGIMYSIINESGEYFEKFVEYNFKITFLLHALSSPQGKPICGFLLEDVVHDVEVSNYNVYTETITQTNHASTIFNLLTKQIEQGKSFDEILIKLNNKYNKL